MWISLMCLVFVTQTLSISFLKYISEIHVSSYHLELTSQIHLHFFNSFSSLKFIFISLIHFHLSNSFVQPIPQIHVLNVLLHNKRVLVFGKRIQTKWKRFCAIWWLTYSHWYSQYIISFIENNCLLQKCLNCLKLGSNIFCRIQFCDADIQLIVQ